MSKERGPQGFRDWYARQEGDRWPALETACVAPARHHALEAGLLQTYWMDEASVLAARWLEPEPGDRILDLCAAPGGKTLAILSEAWRQGMADTLSLVANELSQTRRTRLRRVLEGHLPPEIQGRVSVTSHDAARYGQFKPAAFRRVLLDAPCSSERHLIQDPRYLDDWSPGRSRRLAQQSYAMLLSALQCLEPGGTVVYATCALATDENDGVVGRVLERLDQQAEKLGYRAAPALPSRDDPNLMPSWAEACTHGIRVLPDRADGRGPMYISRLVKEAGA